ncbi:helix-turn-helix domain-containing protein [Marinovum algicola]|uniref:helix-turn-helix domain-containing protein n=1 Tax=Roseobacteraceae TaxID=2854170 RepID=UPI0032EC1067
MTELSKWRQDWARAVRRASSLSTRTRLVGQELALNFANGSAWQCNASREALAERLGVHEVTVRRALAELVDVGWLSKAMATSRSGSSYHAFLIPETTRGKVVPFTGEKGRNAGQGSKPLGVVQ